MLDLDTDTYICRKQFVADEKTIVIVEGILLYRPPIDSFFDYRIFLDIDFDEVMYRATLRDVPKYGEGFLQKYKKRYIPVQQIYLSKFSPKSKCDIVINNTDFDKPLIEG